MDIGWCWYILLYIYIYTQICESSFLGLIGHPASHLWNSHRARLLSGNPKEDQSWVDSYPGRKAEHALNYINFIADNYSEYFAKSEWGKSKGNILYCFAKLFCKTSYLILTLIYTCTNIYLCRYFHLKHLASSSWSMKLTTATSQKIPSQDEKLSVKLGKKRISVVKCDLVVVKVRTLIYIVYICFYIYKMLW